MDYLKMILTGYLENQEYLTEYFIREQKKAEKEFINANEFFGKSNEVIQFFYEDIDNRLGERRNELYFMLGEAKNKTSNYRDTNSNSHLSYDEQCQESIKYCESELKRLTRNDFSVHINKTYWIGNLWNKDIMFIEHFLKLAEKKLNKPDEQPQPEPKPEKENPYPEIFKENGFNIFEQIHDNYKDEIYVTANYSFLYYAMCKDDLIHCGGTEFIKFLSSNYDIHIDRIDSRQSGSNTRTNYYDSIKTQ